MQKSVFIRGGGGLASRGAVLAAFLSRQILQPNVLETNCDY